MRGGKKMMFGRDIKNNWNFINDDLETVSNKLNLAQAIINRLNTDLGFYDWCYTQYGGNLSNVFGMKNNSNTLEYLRIEIESTLQQDPRIRVVNANCSKEDSKTVSVELNVLTIGSDEIVTINLIIQDDLKVQINKEAK